MKLSLFTALFALTLALSANGQNAPTKKTATMYETGSIVYSCESNFDNLIKNFKPANIANASDYVIFGYAFLESISDSTAYRAYAHYFASDRAIVPNEKNTKRPPVYGAEPALLSIEPQAAPRDSYERFKATVRLEDMVYVVNFRYKDQVYADYVICDSETRTVRFDTFFGNINIWVNAN